MIGGQLKFVVMKALTDDKMSGYSLIKHIEEHTGCWKPSAGSIYPLLEDMHKDGFLHVEQKGRRKVYNITKKGRDEFERLATKRAEFIGKMIDGLKVFGTFHADGDTGNIIEMLERIQKGEAPLIDINPELSQLRLELFKSYKKGMLQGHKKEIKQIIKKATMQIRNLK